jgi:GNAT superfamily N-acetyltransferase
MDQLLSTTVLKEGTAVTVHLVMPPEASLAYKMHSFLKHKGMPWQMHWLEAFAGRCDCLETRFYLLMIEGEPISNIMTVETCGIGILGHVFTRPAWRGRGAASILMRVVCDDFASREGTALYLGTGYDSVPWRLYRKYGFEGFIPNAGLMQWIRRPQRLDAMFGPEGLTVRPVCWGDWPLLHCLFVQEGNDVVKNIALRRFGQADMEGGFLALQERMRANAEMKVAVATNAAGMTVAFGTATPLDAMFTDYVLVDLFAHPAAVAALGSLLEALHLPKDKPLLALVDESSSRRRRALESAGFCCVGRLPEAIKMDHCRASLLLMLKPAGLQ